MLPTLIVRVFAIWSLFWAVLLLYEWLRPRRLDRAFLYFATWFVGAAVLSAARIILT